MIASSVSFSPSISAATVADDVVGQLAAPLLDLLEEVAVQLGGGVEAGDDVGRNRDEVKRQPPEHVEILRGSPSSTEMIRVGNSNVSAFTRSA